MGICALGDIPPVFVEVAKALYGEAVDPRELWDVSKNMDAADVHVPGATKEEKSADRQRRIARMGLAATGVATVGGVHAIQATIGQHRLRTAAREATTEAPKVGRFVRKLPVSPKTAATIGTAGWLGLHAVELTGDTLAARAQVKAMRAESRKAESARKESASKQRAAAKKATGTTVSKAAFGWLRPTKKVMTEPQAIRHTAALSRAATKGDRIVQGAVLGGTALLAHRTGVRAGRRRAEADIAKAALVRTPINGVKAINSGGLSGGLGRHGRLIGGKTPPPVLQPVARALPKKIVDNSVVKAVGGRGVKFVARNGQRALKTAQEDFGPVEAKAIAKERVATPAKPAKPMTARERQLNSAMGSGGFHFRPRRRPEISKAELVWIGQIAKVDSDKRQVFGWCSLSRVNGQDIVDLQGDYVPLEEIEKSAYRYVIESRKGGDMHKRVSKFSIGDEPLHTADLIESFVVTPEKLEKMHLPADALPLGWWTGFHITADEQWALLKDGQRSGFSIHGTGSRSDYDASAA